MSTQVDLFTAVEPTSVSPAIAKLPVSRSTFYQGDCLVEMSKIADKSVDMILCDLPYGTTACKWDTIIPFDKLWEQYKRIIKPNGAIVLTSSQPFTTVLIQSNFAMFKYCWYWNKENAGNFAVAKYMPHKVIEEVVVFGKGKLNYYPIEEDIEQHKIRPLRPAIDRKNDNAQGMASGYFKHRSDYDNTKRFPKNLLTYNSRANELNSSARLHPTQKPIGLFEYLIKTYTNEGETVLDNCMGSGTTGVACKKLGRNFIGIEKDKKYFEIAKNRINEYK